MVAVIAVLLALLLPALREARRAARSGQCSSNLRQLGLASVAYESDFGGLLASFSWKATRGHSEFDDIEALRRGSGNGVQAAGAQAVDIIRRRTGRENFPLMSGNWIPHVFYTHLVLQDYLAARLPEPTVVCPEDRARLNWQEDPVNKLDVGVWGSLQPGPFQNGSHKRWAYSSSYEFVPASYDEAQNRRLSGRDRLRRRLSQGFLSTTYELPDEPPSFGGVRATDVIFPAGKVHVHDSHGRHVGRDGVFYAYPESVQPILFFDGSVRRARTRDANRGWDPREPDSPDPITMAHGPAAWDPPHPGGSRARRGGFAGYYRWTRGGVRGIDVGAEEIDTGQR